MAALTRRGLLAATGGALGTALVGCGNGSGSEGSGGTVREISMWGELAGGAADLRDGRPARIGDPASALQLMRIYEAALVSTGERVAIPVN